MIYHKQTIRLHPEWKEIDIKEIRDYERQLYYLETSQRQLPETKECIRNVVRILRTNFRKNYLEEE